MTFWGISFIATKIVLEELEPLQIILLRLIFAVIFLTAIAFYTKKSFAVDLKNHSRIFILALIAVFHLWIQVTGLQYTSASNTGWIIGITPVFMALLGVLFFKESLNFIRTSGIVIAFLGLLLLISKGDISNIGLMSNKGDFLILGSAFTWSVYSAVNKKISLTYPPMMTILFLFLMMSILISPVTITNEMIASVYHLSVTGWISVLFLGVLCSGVAYVLWAQALKEMDSAVAGAFLYFEPFVTVLAAFIILNETITFLTILSGLIITGGVILVNLKWKPSFNFKKRMRLLLCPAWNWSLKCWDALWPSWMPC
ncbi:MAG: DMT family transporter [Ignavibacteriaceae bacterium]